MANKNVVFDIVGTLVSYDHLFDAIEARFGADRLRAANINAKLLGYCWIEAAEREYTYLSLSGRYKPFYKLFEALFYRMLSYAGVADPHAFATPADVEFLVAEWRKLGLRPGAAECVAKLRAAGFTVWCLTAADLARVQGYFRTAGVAMPAENLVSCDSQGVAKPQPEAYAPLLQRLTTADGARPWFAAAHMWDVSTARTVGFRGAYCTILESDPLHEIYGDMDAVDTTLPGMADKIIAATK
ncbi:2-haloalkanoic acid dehalogenase [Niveomyces insectorum RCEF 264]|uniref:2-haloalkanoic acid dehalogenase n=1 Tax=Niveomyces insectorum RCEF 264 TaxID=1081102 RepID=A0A167Q824_9HYPO|nr:2-haloalkanoic acid dehalogenase [Niveomyces insectorum RCEF 264]